MDLGLKDKVAVVTGGSRGVGRACAQGLLREGARVALVSRDPERLDKARASMAKETGGTVIAVPTELSSDAAVAAMKDRVFAEFGRIDILVIAAAQVMPEDFLQPDHGEVPDGVG